MIFFQKGLQGFNIIINVRIIYFIVVYLPVLLVILTSTSVIADDWTLHCSTNCTCKWMNGKKSALCNSLYLKKIPTTLSTEIQVLVLNDNQITYLKREEFTELGLINLQKLYLKKSNIQYINSYAFKNLKILIEIDLSDNKIEILEEDTFNGNDRLRILYLNGNPLQRLMAYQFPLLTQLRTLDLHDCLINYIDPLAFINLKYLEYLNLKNNLIENLNDNVFKHMINLKTLTLDDNPWQCNCKLRKFRNWYIESKLNSISLLCKGPLQYKDKEWHKIDEKYFGCSPKVIIFNNEQQHDVIQNDIYVGNNVTLSCLITGDPLPKFTWKVNGKNFVNNVNYICDENIFDSDKIWSNLTIINVTKDDSGMYSCLAENIIGTIIQNISIYPIEVFNDHHHQHVVIVKAPETFWYFCLIMTIFGALFIFVLLFFIACLCKRIQYKQQSNINQNHNDQGKILLDLSMISSNDRRNSCTISENMIKNDEISEIIERKKMNKSSKESQETVKYEELPLNASALSSFPTKLRSKVSRYDDDLFASTSLVQDIFNNSDKKKYPDLLNVSKQVNNTTKNNISSFATLPRKHLMQNNLKDNYFGSNSKSHNEIVNYYDFNKKYTSSGILLHNFLEELQQKQQLKDSLCKTTTIIASTRPYNTKTSLSNPKYDNIGRRITASGNSCLVLPDEDCLINDDTNFSRMYNLNSAVINETEKNQKISMETINDCQKLD